ncbi:carboxylating nicotinate-nucleotide diphosphorylase [Legionella israelensis]|uniref:Probable nicotinate-nucleotide pyrophosphorylase [carboxylating] n=1 Tax=Legionella israelensis TaxID=454 RepID=A0A0W0VWN8_9GAMM|nr:carboxylating nicotinate-nucleotide diphosphorylase [Legionella israelensis]KTD24386.1 nicotinate-nucleotide pyrophosphorylase [Legionella israelensis]QBR84445.1 carboxylating nicotinate-nucleotide diphosphorylase [Legionella israelensis]QBS08725.1 carboxylating nicotinate-nucleotide diphosphorylase [Legionella israelensis]SCY41078.1 nicotinate-nucleotide pyrophosphorylase [carboxylating] [Legionella israelensis DSM 19235]STX58397.1 nicotinate-nucleotide pyrophosphorylase [Legionella israel
MKLDDRQVALDVKRALEEDIGNGDITAALIPEQQMTHAEIISREAMVVAGRPWVEATFKSLDTSIRLEWLVQEGQKLNQAETLCRLQGNARAILTAERTALNFLQTLSATASRTYDFVQQLEGTTAQLLDTRKTLPGLRYAQKYAVVCGGGKNHRFGLYDAFLIKENHIKACGSIAEAIRFARLTRKEVLLEIEVENLNELQEALQAKPDRILLDNFDEDMLKEAVKMNQPKHCALEASGGIDITNIRLMAQTGVDFISVGTITKSVNAIDLSLNFRDSL